MTNHLFNLNQYLMTAFKINLLFIFGFSISIYAQTQIPSNKLNSYIKKSSDFATEKLFDSANFYSNKAWVLSKKINDKELFAKTIYNKSKILYWQNRTTKAIEVLKINTTNNNLKDSMIIRSLGLLGEIYQYKEDYTNALNQYIDIEKKVRKKHIFKQQDSIIMRFINTQMGFIHEKTNNLKTAINYYDKALLYCGNDSECMNNIIYIKSLLYNNKNSFKNTVKYSLQGIAIARKNNYKIFLPSYYLFISSAYLKLNKGDSAIFYAKKGLMDNVHCRRELLFNNIGKGYALRKNYKKSIAFFEKALDHSSDKQAIEFQKNLRDSYILLKDYKKAIYHNKEYLTLKKNNDSLQVRQQLLEITEKYDSDKNKLEIKMLQSENEKKNNQIVFVSIILGLLSLLLGYIIFSYYKQKKHKNLLFIKNRQLAKELKNNGIELSNNNISKKIESSTIDLIQKEKIKTFLNIAIKEEFYLDKNISLSSLAKLASTNTSYLSKVINEDYEKPFTLFINELRISNTLKKLETIPNYKKLTIENIGDKAGFSSNSAFYNSFKKFTGLTPSYYIKKRLLQENN